MTTEDVGQSIDREEKKIKTRDATRRRKIPKIESRSARREDRLANPTPGVVVVLRLSDGRELRGRRAIRRRRGPGSGRARACASRRHHDAVAIARLEFGAHRAREPGARRASRAASLRVLVRPPKNPGWRRVRSVGRGVGFARSGLGIRRDRAARGLLRCP